MRHVQSVLGVSEHRASRTLGQPRSTQRKVRVVRAGEAVLIDAVVSLAGEYGRYGYHRITALLRLEGWRVADNSRGRSSTSKNPGCRTIATPCADPR